MRAPMGPTDGHATLLSARVGMSLSGPIASVRPTLTTSGLPSAADITDRDHHFRKVPYRKSRWSLDDFISGGQQRRRNGEVEDFGGFQIDDQLETRGLLDRQIARLCALQNLVHI